MKPTKILFELIYQNIDWFKEYVCQKTIIITKKTVKINTAVELAPCSR